MVGFLVQIVRAIVTGGVASLNHRLIAVAPPGSKQPEAAAHRELGRNIQELCINVRPQAGPTFVRLVGGRLANRRRELHPRGKMELRRLR